MSSSALLYAGAGCALPLQCHQNPRHLTWCLPAGVSDEGLWLPNTERPAWLDGSLPGDRGFDPLGLAKPTEYLQVGFRPRDAVCCLSHCSFPAAALSPHGMESGAHQTF